ncbi:MAG: NADH-quinone oxidoreductase subunit C [Candidatus Cohnella colombiensis]|uniref:NADH-quinone oxidoreductase subunit C n=1 Tax=Candidatus Cohnella colombiensis TaxID=3121368 RepID=A0AA95JCI8_9BACL|nr:MAG: NADH-quinone oxidoreductase subunit C [Cohnella sp.]
MTEENKPGEELRTNSDTEAPKEEAPASEATPAPEASPAPEPASVAEEAPKERRVETDEEKAARRKAAFEARQAMKAEQAQAAAEAAKAAQQAGAVTATPSPASTDATPTASGAVADTPVDAPPPKPPSPNQPRLDRTVKLLRELIAEDAVEESYINELNDDLPTLVVKNEHWLQAAKLFLNHSDLDCNYLRNVTGVDYETYMEVVYYPLSLNSKECYCIKVRTDREQPAVASVTPVWETANWNEREIYDLLGIEFPGHPNLTRIMMPDDWVGHPLRKDYVPLDPEV